MDSIHLVPPCSCDHFVSASCQGEHCNVCAIASGTLTDATHKVGEEIPYDDPTPFPRHNLTAYVCCDCFRNIMGPAAPCRNGSPK